MLLVKGKTQYLLQAALFALLVGVSGLASAETPTSVTAAKSAVTTNVTQADLKQARPKVNINQASADELVEALIGVGPSKAEAIVAWREANGAFTSLEDFGKVKGIGAATIEKNKSNIQF